MKYPYLFLVAATLAISGIADDVASSEKQTRIDTFESVWQEVNDKHWDPEFGGLNWQAVHDEFRPLAEKTTNAEQLRKVIADMLARLKLSHFRIIPGTVYSELDGGQKSGDGSTGIDVRVLDGKAVVTAVYPGFPAGLLGIRPGWTIRKIGFELMDPIIEDFAAQNQDSTLKDLTLRRAVLSRLEGPLGENVQVEFLDGKNQSLVKTLTRELPRGSLTTLGYLGPQYAWIDNRKLDDGKAGVGYIAFNMFLDPSAIMPKFADAVQGCFGCNGIIIDLRGNPGGIGGMAMGMANWFVDRKDQRLGTLYLRDTALKFVLNPRAETYGGPLAILVDSCSASTSEIFAGGLQDLGRARIFGSKTAAAALPSVIEKLPNGDAFQYAIANYVSEGGKELEGRGVTPDVAAPLTRQALLEGRDPALDAAMDWIKSQKTTHE